MVTNFSLVIQAGPNPGQRTGLAKDSFVIGRDPGCDLHIQDIEVSRRHARVIAQSGGFVLEDLGSTNGTFVNGERVSTVTVLRPGDEIRLGDVVTLRYELDLNSLETTPPAVARPPRSTPAVPQPPTASLPSLDPPPAATSVPRNLPPQPAAAPQPSAAPAGPASPPARPAPSADEPLALRMAAERNFVDPLQYDPATEAEVPAAAPPSRRPRRKGIRLSRNAMLGCGGLLLLGLCSAIAFLFYVDANSLWCDVFGNLIPACRPIVLP
ncbi:MAG: FHA domain-containing protein [Anaerolineales bacterium]|nr:FHA domain-containing protein [Anaerolineales bacterium]